MDGRWMGGVAEEVQGRCRGALGRGALWSDVWAEAYCGQRVVGGVAGNALAASSVHRGATPHLSPKPPPLLLRFAEIEKAYLRAEVVAPSSDRPYGLSDTEKMGSGGACTHGRTATCQSNQIKWHLSVGPRLQNSHKSHAFSRSATPSMPMSTTPALVTTYLAARRTVQVPIVRYVRYIRYIRYMRRAGLVWEDLRSKLADYGRREREAADMIAAQRSFEHAMTVLGVSAPKLPVRGGGQRFYTTNDAFS